MGRYIVLDAAALEKELASLPDWKQAGDAIAADFKFADFRAAMLFVNMVAFECEALDHHPDLTNTYNRVGLKFSTHDAGNKVTDMDVKLARYASKAAQDLQGVSK